MTSTFPNRTSTIRDILRQSTAEAHAALDARIMAMFSAGELGYVTFLRCAANAVFPLENALESAGVAGILSDWNERSRKAALRRDLNDFGVTGLPTQQPPAIRSEAFLYGVLYVLEGSRLGSQWLARQAAAHPSPRVRTATRYLRHGQAERFWLLFLERLEASEPVRQAQQEAAAGAREAFAVFEAAHTAPIDTQ